MKENTRKTIFDRGGLYLILYVNTMTVILKIGYHDEPVSCDRVV